MASGPGPPQPKAILRGHKAQVHAAAFVRSNQRLVTGDADGFVVAWDLTIMRPRAVWRAHENAILGLAGWGHERIITHGRDNKLVVWKLPESDEAVLSTAPPLDPLGEPRPQPWMLHLLEVNTMNFCCFGHCPVYTGGSASASELLISVPNTLASEAIDIFHLPSQRRIHTVKLGEKNGMAMALSLFYQDNAVLTIVAGYENGLATVAQLTDDNSWTVRYKAQPHSQPILSLGVGPSKNYFVTSSADALIVKHPIPMNLTQSSPAEIPPSQTDAPVLEYTPSSASDEATVVVKKTPVSALSAALAADDSFRPVKPVTKQASSVIQTQPLKVVNTKHSGQQGLQIRSDGRIFATAGWDARVRVYSTKTLKELAVLKWHQVGCYATAFATVCQKEVQDDNQKDLSKVREVKETQMEMDQLREEQGSKALTTRRAGGLVPKLGDLTVKEKRILQATTAHWIVAGAKDGKVSLWDVY